MNLRSKNALTVSEAAVMLGISQEAVRKAIRQGRIQAFAESFPGGQKYWLDRKAVLAWKERRDA